MTTNRPRRFHSLITEIQYAYWVGRGANFVQEPVHGLPDDELIAEVSRRHDGVPADVLAGCLRADYTMLENYRWSEGPRYRYQ